MIEEKVKFISDNWGILTCSEIASKVQLSENEVRKIVKKLRKMGVKLRREKKEDDVVKAVLEFINQLKIQ